MPTSDVSSLTLRLTGRDARATEPRIGCPTALPRIDHSMIVPRAGRSTTFVAVRNRSEGNIRLPWIRIEVYLNTWETKENGVVQGEGEISHISDPELNGRYRYAVIQTGPRPRGEEYAGRIMLYTSNPMGLPCDE